MPNELQFRNYFSTALRREIAELYASVGIANFALAVVSIFEPIFLYAVLHLSVPDILLFNGIVYAVYLFGIIVGGKVATRFGYAHGILFAIPFQILYWVFLYAGRTTMCCYGWRQYFTASTKVCTGRRLTPRFPALPKTNSVAANILFCTPL